MIILITGASASGKSTVAMELSKVISAIIIPQDAFYNVDEFMLFPYDKVNDGRLELPDMIDWNKLITTIRSIPQSVNIIVEGHCLYTCKQLIELADYMFYLTISYSMCKKRYVSRYADNYTIEQLEMKEKYFDKWTWPIHLQYYENYVRHVDCFQIPCDLKSINIIKDIIYT